MLKEFYSPFASYFFFKRAFALLRSVKSLEEVKGKVPRATGSARLSALTEAAGSLKITFHLNLL